nr:hypothetical protein Iba_chr03dCG10540 [Ipomoea batatas]
MQNICPRKRKGWERRHIRAGRKDTWRATCRGIRISEYRIDDVSSEHRGIRAERTFGFGLAYYVLTTFADFAVNGCEVTCKKKKSNRFK